MDSYRFRQELRCRFYRINSGYDSTTLTLARQAAKRQAEMSDEDRAKACDNLASDMVDWDRVERGMTQKVLCDD